MTYFEAILFGIVQGITEFLPISSTAHIIITELLLGYHFPGLAFEIYLHLASALAVIVFFKKDIYKIIAGFLDYFNNKTSENHTHFKFALFILIATAITGSLGIALRSFADNYMKTPAFMAGALVITGLFLIIIERFHRYGIRTEKEMKISDAIFVGLGQTLAVLPGISRSGSTLITALFAGLSRETAVRYSFILVIPVILGSSVLALGELNWEMWQWLGTGPLVLSFVISFIFSWIGIIWLIDFLKKGRLLYFAIYCFVIAFLVYRFL